jgi:hypothetical protein
MTTNFSGSPDVSGPNVSGSAKIYPFPARGRFAAASQGDGLRQAANVLLAPGVKVASGSGWYHDAAIQTERLGKN